MPWTYLTRWNLHHIDEDVSSRETDKLALVTQDENLIACCYYL